MKKYIMGIDIGGTKCAVLLGRAQGDADDIIIDKLRFETRVGRGWRAVTEELLDNVEEIIKKNALSPEDILCAGISCGGPLDSRRGVILAPPNLPDWECVPIVDMIEERFGFDAYLQNDANACALAEWKFGAGKGLRNMIFLTFGTGMLVNFVNSCVSACSGTPVICAMKGEAAAGGSSDIYNGSLWSANASAFAVDLSSLKADAQRNFPASKKVIEMKSSASSTDSTYILTK